MAILSMPDEITYLFANKLDSFEDFIRFGVVCKSWNSVYRDTRKNRRFMPWLMLNEVGGIQKCFSLSSKIVFNFESLFTTERKLWGSRFGWAVAYSLDLNVHLVNPFSRVKLQLPPQSTFEYQDKNQLPPSFLLKAFITKCVLSSPPDDPKDSCVVLAINSEFRRLSFARPGDAAWISIKSPRWSYADAIFFQGQFYAVTVRGDLTVIDINTSQPKATDFASPPEGFDGTNNVYLVEFSGDLYFVERVIYFDRRYKMLRTTHFKIHKLDLSTRRWTQVLDLGDHALFLGANTSFAILAPEFPECRRNCIYVTDDDSSLHITPFNDMGVYDFEEKTIQPIFSGKDTSSDISRPVFIMPGF